MSECDEFILFKNFSNSHKIYHISSMIIVPVNAGRPYGGRAFFVNNKFNNIKCDFVSEFISVLTFDFKGLPLCIIGVYMPYDDKKTINWSNFNISICAIESIIEYYSEKGYYLLITGDFNADHRRKNRFDNALNEFIINNNLYHLSNDALTLCKYSYKKGNYYSCIDHSFIVNNNKLHYKKCLYLSDWFFESDHNLILILFKANNLGQLSIPIFLPNDRVRDVSQNIKYRNKSDDKRK
jgi:hypothetical protein